MFPRFPGRKVRIVYFAAVDFNESSLADFANLLDEQQDMHIQKGVRHALTHQLIRDGHIPDNGENHLELALTRIAMALVQCYSRFDAI